MLNRKADIHAGEFGECGFKNQAVIPVDLVVSISELMLECTTILAQNKDKGKCCGLRLRHGKEPV